ncbi:MAG: hypothetical protein EOP74_02540 [Variovorax sp.]|nr:MAG: hypothetical protein EOP74_02540 [Variovorax sp.]
MLTATVFADIFPEERASVRAARSEDADRVRRMLATDNADWSDEDIDIAMAHAHTTLGGPEAFKWILPVWLQRSAANPHHGWLTVSEVLADKLDRAGFDDWPEVQRAAVVPLLSGWLHMQETAFTDDAVPYKPEDDAALRDWLKARTP